MVLSTYESLGTALTTKLIVNCYPKSSFNLLPLFKVMRKGEWYITFVVKLCCLEKYLCSLVAKVRRESGWEGGGHGIMNATLRNEPGPSDWVVVLDNHPHYQRRVNGYMILNLCLGRLSGRYILWHFWLW